MKFSEMPYTRPDYSALFQQIDDMTAKLQKGTTAEQLEIYKQVETLESNVVTQATICMIRNSVDTLDKFYETEQTYNDEHIPLLNDICSPLRKRWFNRPIAQNLKKI